MIFPNIFRLIVLAAIVAGCQTPGVHQQEVLQDDETSSAFRLLTQSSHWRLTDIIDIDFKAYHTQGLVKIGDTFYVSAVEKTEKTKTYGKTDSLWDFSQTRTAGKGRGWLFKFNSEGHLLGKTELTRSDSFHPGGIDYDGQHIWVPVAEYRPNSSTDIYRVDPVTMEAVLAFRANDHIGSIVHNPERGTFHGASWGGRRLYEWQVSFNGLGVGEIQKESWEPNPTHYIDYQDCQYSGVNYMLCGGLKTFASPLGQIALGGLELIDISSSKPKPVQLLPVTQYWSANMNLTQKNDTPQGASMIVSQNPFWAEPIKGQPATPQGKKIMRLYFMPDHDGESKLLVYEVVVPFLAN